MTTNNKFYITLWGGLGDFLKIYYTHHNWRCLEALKARRPDIKIKALVYSLNPSAKEFIEHHPCIDEIFQPDLPLVEMRIKGLKAFKEFIEHHPCIADGYIPLQNAGPWIRNLPKSKPAIYLSDKDKQFIKDIRKRTKRYIALHPFSAMPAHPAHSRTAMATDKYMPIIEGLGKKGYSVITLGKSRPHRSETFDFEADNLINLVNKIDSRIALALVDGSAGFIGANSCFMCHAWLEQKRSFVVMSYLWATQITKNGFTNNRRKQPQNKIVFLPKDRDSAPYGRIQQEAINWFQ
jgi:ADP-heptose:LPS heptosyltransferase